MLPINDIHRALVRSVHDEVTKKLTDKSLVLEKPKSTESERSPFLTNGDGQVYCISDDEVQLKVSNAKYIDSAQLVYRELPKEIKELAEKKLEERKMAATTPAIQPYVTSRRMELLPYSQPDQVIQASGTSDAIAQSKDTSYETLEGYFFEIDKHDIKFKNNNNNLFQLMAREDICKKACDTAEIDEYSRYIYGFPNIYSMGLPQLMMLSSDKRTELKELITEFNSADQKRKETIAVKVGTECIKHWKEGQPYRDSDKEVYDQATDNSKSKSADTSTVAKKTSDALATLGGKDKVLKNIETLLNYERDTTALRRDLKDWTLQNAPAFTGRMPNHEQALASTINFEQLKAEAGKIKLNQKHEVADAERLTTIAGLKNVIESREIVDMETGNLFIPKGVYRHQEDCKEFKYRVLILVDLYWKVGCDDGLKKDYAGGEIDAGTLTYIGANLCNLDALIQRNLE